MPTGSSCDAWYRRRMSWRYDVVGFLDGDFGLAVAARNTVQALAASSRSGRAVSIEPPAIVRELARVLGLVGPVEPVSIGGPAAGPLARRVTLFQMNPLEIAWYARQWRGAVERLAGAVCVPFWELPSSRRLGTGA